MVTVSRVSASVLSGRMYTIYIFSDKHTSAREAIQISPPNLSEGGSLRSPIINKTFCSKLAHAQYIASINRTHYKYTPLVQVSSRGSVKTATRPRDFL